jgi:anti-anti-sigma factor
MTEPVARPVLEHYARGGAEVLVVREAELVLAETVERLGAELRLAIDASPATRFILDLSAVTYLTSGAIGLLLNVRAHLAQQGMPLALAGATGEVARVLEHARLGDLLPMYPDIEAALKALICQ